MTDLYDYETNEKLTAEDLDISEDEYDRLIIESVELGPESSGAVDCYGRTVYAQ